MNVTTCIVQCYEGDLDEVYIRMLDTAYKYCNSEDDCSISIDIDEKNNCITIYYIDLEGSLIYDKYI